MDGERHQTALSPFDSGCWTPYCLPPPSHPSLPSPTCFPALPVLSIQLLRSLEEVWISDSYVLCGRVSSPVAVTSSTGCAGDNAVGKGAEIRFDSLEHEALEDAYLLEHQRVLESGTRRCGPGVGAEGP
ncbi:hypothetical protein G5714_018034 [Onychostoma macrolepis]|uniref:Uncharacterized protein n=1 Tax=Onychostoma macrolepis TaxID=369639 RepID=A0A7J6C6Z6_9TELE|nr:hypothetical protein G5714_018034 [Onychostoma macrolepis]